ncbi:hypothetical protein AB7C87_19650 [Natrarchaeobius sp. A-rgal3]|uniref:hypothetical protein n=1 Tax=Natrarchaeobius versutus TaxID=1679078 RepID=UPI0035104583
MSDDEREGFRDGLESSEGDPRVAALFNVVLSVLFGWTVVWGLSFMGVTELTLVNVAFVALVIFAITQFVIKP